jgi:hypothetical protein
MIVCKKRNGVKCTIEKGAIIAGTKLRVIVLQVDIFVVEIFPAAVNLGTCLLPLQTGEKSFLDDAVT